MIELRHLRHFIAVAEELNWELAMAGLTWQSRTKRTYQPAQNGAPVKGVYTQSIQLTSGRFAVLENGKNFTLVPWKPVVDRRLGQHVSAVLRSHSII